MADEWREHVLRWRELTAPLRAGGAPDANEEYLIFQTLVGAWPIGRERLEAYLEKALREAKRNTSWVEQDHDWEARGAGASRVALLDHGPFLDDFEPFAARVAEAGRRAALGQLLLKLTVAGRRPTSTRATSSRRSRSSTPTTAGRSTGTRAARRSTRCARGAAPTARDDEAVPHPARARPARAPAGGVRAAPTSRSTPAPGVCAFSRGGEVLAVVVLRAAGGRGGDCAASPGPWRDVLTGEERELGDEAAVAGVVDANGLALLERA